jgi:hypothetical protein
MTPIELLADTITRNAELLKMTLADFSDQDMLARPVPAANHAAWQMAHLVGSTAQLVGIVAPGVPPEGAVKWADKFGGKTAAVDDAAFFPSKSELLETRGHTSGAVAQWVSGLTQADLERPTPERMAGFAPTVGHLVTMTISHFMMHTGQFQVIRRKLGKPLLF